MDVIYDCANNFIKLNKIKYHFVFVQNRKSHDIVLDFHPTDFRHATGLHHVTDIVIENNPSKLISSILQTKPLITDEKLDKSIKFKEYSPRYGSIKERVSDMRFLEKCLDSSFYMRIYQVQPFGSQISADYFIESYCSTISASVYIFIRKRSESNNFVVVSFFRKKTPFIGISTHWMLKEKISDNITTELYRHRNYKK